MTGISTKAKRRAIPGISLQELFEAGLVDEFHHLRDSIDMPFQMTRHPYLPELPKRTKEGHQASDDATIGKKSDDGP